MPKVLHGSSAGISLKILVILLKVKHKKGGRVIDSYGVARTIEK